VLSVNIADKRTPVCVIQLLWCIKRKNMKQLLLLLIAFHSTLVFGQRELKVYARLHSVDINSDIFAPEKVETETFMVDKISPIVEFGNIDGVKFGLRIEIHESKINPEISYIIRRNMYFRRPYEQEWNLINTSLNTYNILSSEIQVDFSEQDRLGHHNSVEETRKIGDEYLKFNIVYDCIYQWN
jgi:hypothetical protein